MDVTINIIKTLSFISLSIEYTDRMDLNVFPFLIFNFPSKNAFHYYLKIITGTR